MTNIETNDSARRRFLRGCHYGYDKAQQRIGDLAIEIETRLRAGHAELSELRRRRDERSVAVIQRQRVHLNRQLVLRRIMDAILITIVGFNPWIIKRFMAQREVRRIDPKVLRRTLDHAGRLNSQDRYTFNLVGDLTTVVDVADLVQIDLTPGHPKQWKLIELKEGRINELLAEVIQDAQTAADEQVEQIRLSLGEKAAKQAQRMIRQQTRLREVRKILETDRGVDPLIGQEIILTREVVELGDYREVLKKIIDEAQKQAVGAASLDECLYLVGVRIRFGDGANSRLRMARHCGVHADVRGEWGTVRVHG